MSILITGNMGYVGPSVVRQLRHSRPEELLIGYDTGYFANAMTSSLLFPECQLTAQLFGDVRGIPEGVFDGVDAVVQLAAISNDPMGNAYEAVTRDINHDASIDIAQKAKAAGVKSFVFASSCSVYGFAEDGARNESSAVNPLTAYARSKVATETDLQTLADKNFKVTCLRFATACGMSPRLRLDLVLNDFVASAIAAKKITILSDGTPWRPLINTKDMARAIDWAVGRNPASGGEYLIVNAGSDEWNYQVKDLAAAVRRQMPHVEVSINPEAQPDKRSYRVDFSLFRQLAPKHQPIHSLDGTVRELRSGLEQLGFADANFRESRLIRLKMLNALKTSGSLTDDLYWKPITP
ncbi:MAG TPA: SDR family oxidoreductase [Verrucomicrobiae bacterium]|jgi:nucleoside-diphosphate-sugar epimerase|nr:SDR family oxidoreductase [Verrucomicrobiae bacterium]